MSDFIIRGDNNRIHKSAVVGPNVELGSNNYIGPYCVLAGRVRLGNGNILISHVSVGQPPQHRRFPHEPEAFETTGTVVIGSNNILREFVTVHQPYMSETSLGSNCYLMAYSHISHDTVVEDGVTIANNVQIGGHSVLMRDCNLGLSAVLHQFTVVGSYAMLGMGSISAKHIIPFNKYVGSSPKRIGLNKVGLERYGFSNDEIRMLDEWSKQYLVSGEGQPGIEKLKAEVERFESYVQERSH